MNSKLTLVGAGPGDPDLISIKGVKALATADVVLYDALVHPDLLDHAPKKARKVYVGKRAGQHSFKQEEINRLIVDFALNEGHVVRLKGGDPFVFARGKEEAEYAETFNIPVAVVPGISSITLPGYYGVPLTRRGINESFWVVTATTSSGELSKDVRLVAQSTATGVFLMGLGKLESIIKAYAAAGKTGTPAAIISKGSLPDGQILFGHVHDLMALKREHNPPAPALIVIGEAVGTHEHFYELVKTVEKEYTR
ncbi:MAG: uroporphyrinogen-III C-methyltransferase [Cytophagales bacterium]|nr:uroporphyrinogen-III C-methyltransferase [Cytophagales bacterium]